MRKLLYCLLLCCFSLSPARAEDTTTIAAFGDSLFAGLGVAPEDAFPAQLERRLIADGYHTKVINDGISGDTTAGGVGRTDALLAQKPDLVLVELGANDMLRGLPPLETRAHLNQILLRLQHANVKIIVMGQKAPLLYGHAYSQDYDSLFCDLAKKYDALCYPFFLDGAFNNPDLMQADGLHPNAAGVKLILDKVYPYVKRALK